MHQFAAVATHGLTSALACRAEDVRETVFAALSYVKKIFSLVVATLAVMFFVAVLIWVYAPDMVQMQASKGQFPNLRSLPLAMSAPDESILVTLSGVSLCVCVCCSDWCMFVMDWGFRSGGGLGEAIGPYWEHGANSTAFTDGPGGIVKTKWFHWTIDMAFFIIFVLFFMNILLVVMVDGVAEYKTQKQERDSRKQSHCLVCGLSRDLFDEHGNSFETHRGVSFQRLSFLHRVSAPPRCCRRAFPLQKLLPGKARKP